MATMVISPNDPETLPFASRLADLAARQDVADDERWEHVASTARNIADRLRTREGEGQLLSSFHLHCGLARYLTDPCRVVDEHSALGQTPLPRTLTALINEALATPSVPSGPALVAVFELLRTSANFCMDHGTFTPCSGYACIKDTIGFQMITVNSSCQRAFLSQWYHYCIAILQYMWNHHNPYPSPSWNLRFSKRQQVLS